MISANRENAGMFDNSIGVNDVLRGAAADINHERAHFFLLIAQERERRSEAVEHNVIDFQLQPFDGANWILQAIEISVHDVHIHFDARPDHPDRVQNSALSIDMKMLANQMHDAIFGGKIDRFGVANRVLHIFFHNLAIIRSNGMKAAIVEAAHVAAGDAEINAAHFGVGGLFGFDNGIANVLGSGVGVDNFADDRADFRSADVQSNDDGR